MPAYPTSRCRYCQRSDICLSENDSDCPTAEKKLKAAQRRWEKRLYRRLLAHRLRALVGLVRGEGRCTPMKTQCAELAMVAVKFIKEKR
jgi:hypothetical protein